MMKFQLTEEQYKTWLTNIIRANKTLDFEWFNDINNRARCKIIMSYWAARYGATKEMKYKNGHKKLKHILKMSRNKRIWRYYLVELDKASKVC